MVNEVRKTQDLTGRTLGPYRVLSQLGQGGMATVYLAEQTSIGRKVALKIMPSYFLHDPTFLERFNREVRIIAKLQHPRILPVYDFGEFEGQPYIVMAYMPGGTLSDRIRGKGKIGLEEAVRYVGQIAEGLDHAHSKGIIHRDFKPSNVLLDEGGNVYLADFGIAKVSEATAQLTGSGIIGTPAYMAPEMADRGEVTPSVDIYALGVTLYEMLTGRYPYSGDTPLRVMMAHVSEPIPDVRVERPDLPAGVAEVVRRAMAKAPASRYKTASELAEALRAAAAGQPLVATRSAADIHEAATIDIGVTEPERRQALREAAPAPAPSKAARSKVPIALIAVGIVVLCGILVTGGVLIRRLGNGSGQRLGDRGSMMAEGIVTEEGQAPVTEVVDEQGGPEQPQVVGVTVMPDQAGLSPSSTPPPSPTPDLGPVITEAVLRFDEEMRHLLETGDTSRIDQAARGKALAERLEAADILRRAGNCVWDYDHRGLYVEEIRHIGATKFEVLALVDRGGTVFCGPVERSEYAFPGPYRAIYTVELFPDGWYVTDYEPVKE